MVRTAEVRPVHISGRAHVRKPTYACSHAPVSYTHLDVYKRQVLAFGERTPGACARLLAVAVGPRIMASLPLAQASAAIVAGDSVVVTLRHASWGVARRGPPALASM